MYKYYEFLIAAPNKNLCFGLACDEKTSLDEFDDLKYFLAEQDVCGLQYVDNFYIKDITEISEKDALEKYGEDLYRIY